MRTRAGAEAARLAFASNGVVPMGVSKKSAPELPIESPIPFRSGSNGEYAPRAPTARDRLAEELYAKESDARAKKHGIPRRQFVESSAGTTLALMIINQVYGCSSDDGGNNRSGADAGIDA